jgi:hypothetical protein
VETSPVTIAEFIAKWKKAELRERAAAQEHFLDLCHLVQVDAAVCAAYAWGVHASATNRMCVSCLR